MTIDSVLRIRSDVRFRRVPPETVAIRQSAGEVLVLNGVAGRILELCDGRRSLSDLVTSLLSEYEVVRPELERDVLAFAGELVEGGLAEEAR